jgi:putative membrane protein
MGFGAIWLIVLLAVLVAAVVAVVLAVGSDGGRAPDEDRAETILRERLAAGEIDEREYRERRDVLAGSRGHRTGGGDRRPTIIIVAAAVVIVAAILVAVATFGGWGWPMGDHPRGPMQHMTDQRTPAGTVPDPIPGAPEITVEGGEMWFEPATVEVTAGEPLNLTFENRGEVFHDLTIDELDLVIEAEPGERGTAGLEIAEPGDYDFYCSVAGHESGGMRGRLTVTDGGG